MMRYDAIVIGSGPAGLSAAINLKIYQKDFLWFGNGNFSDKVEKAELIRNYPGLPDVSGAELLKQYKKHAKAMGLSITKKLVSTIYPMGDYYAVMAENEVYETNTIILATGVVMTKPYAGEEEFLGRGVSYCATCDGSLYQGKTIAAIATSKRFEHELSYLAQLADKMYLFPFYKDCSVAEDNVEIVSASVKEIGGSMRVEKLLLGTGEQLATDGVFIMRNAIAPTTLLSGLLVEDGHIAVNRNMETNLPGVFAAGDCVGKPYQYTKAVGEGNIAAHGVISYLGEK